MRGSGLICLFLVLGYIGVLQSKVYVVPGHFNRLIEAIVSVRDGDTVAIRPTVPGYFPYEPGIYHWRGKRVVVGIWEVGTPSPREGLITSNVDIYPDGFYQPIYDEDTTGYWTPQERLTGPDTLVDIMAHPFYDPVRNWFWVVWKRDPVGVTPYDDDVAMWYDFNTGEWSPIYDVTGSYEEGDTFPEFRIYGMVDTEGKVWLSWGRETDNGTEDCDLMYRIYDQGWGPIGYVDSSHYYMSSIYIADAGGDIWAIQNKLIQDPPGWGTHETFARRYENGHFGDSIWISHQGWGTDETVNHATHDRFGRIHVVWQEYFSGGVFYRQYSGGTWQPIRLVNDTSRYTGSGSVWVDADSLTGRIYIAFTGWRTDTVVGHHVFLTYSDDDGVTWSEPVKVSEEQVNMFSYPKVLVMDTSELWVFWSKEYSWVNTHTRARHYVNGTWYPVVQLDDSTSPSLSPWGDRVPGEIWLTFDGGYGNLVDPPDIWLVRWIPTGFEEVAPIQLPFYQVTMQGHEIVVSGIPGDKGVVEVYDRIGRKMGILWQGVFTGKEIRLRKPARWTPGIYWVVLRTPRHRAVTPMVLAR